MKKTRPNWGLINIICLTILITVLVWALAIHFHVVPILISLYAIYFLWIAKEMHESDQHAE